MANDKDPEIEALTAAFYAAFDNRGARAPAGEALRAMFDASATVTRVAGDLIDAWTPDAFIAPRVAMLADGTLSDFHEWEAEARTVVLGEIASRWSTYEKVGVLNGAPYRGGGDKFIQFHRREGRWRIVSILWKDREA